MNHAEMCTEWTALVTNFVLFTLSSGPAEAQARSISAFFRVSKNWGVVGTLAFYCRPPYFQIEKYWTYHCVGIICYMRLTMAI